MNKLTHHTNNTINTINNKHKHKPNQITKHVNNKTQTATSAKQLQTLTTHLKPA